MSRFSYLILLTLVLASCGTAGNRFKIEGRFLNLNQGEFYVYSPDGITNGIDTIKILGGRFSKEIACHRQGMLMVVFPNFSEQPVFAVPGKSVDIKADASHMKEMTINGTKDNDLMTGFRRQILHVSPPEEARLAEQFVKDNPASMVGVYLVMKYFLKTPHPNYVKAAQLVALMQKQQPRNGMLVKMGQQLSSLKQGAVNTKLPRFKVATIDGGTVTDAYFSGATGVISVWASWSYDSQDMQRKLKALQRGKAGKLKIVSICVDASVQDCKNWMKNDTITWPTVCDGNLFRGKLIKQLGLTEVPGNVVIKGGRIVARGLTNQQLDDQLKNL